MTEPKHDAADYANLHKQQDRHVCPACGLTNVDYKVKVRHLCRDAICYDCGATWTETYELIGYKDLEPGKAGG